MPKILLRSIIQLLLFNQCIYFNYLQDNFVYRYMVFNFGWIITYSQYIPVFQLYQASRSPYQVRYLTFIEYITMDLGFMTKICTKILSHDEMTYLHSNNAKGTTIFNEVLQKCESMINSILVDWLSWGGPQLFCGGYKCMCHAGFQKQGLL